MLKVLVLKQSKLSPLKLSSILNSIPLISCQLPVRCCCILRDVMEHLQNFLISLSIINYKWCCAVVIIIMVIIMINKKNNNGKIRHRFQKAVKCLLITTFFAISVVVSSWSSSTRLSICHWWWLNKVKTQTRQKVCYGLWLWDKTNQKRALWK